MAAPSYDPYLQFNPTFRYGGRSWGANDMDAFKKLLRRRGVNYDRWARNHATAAKVFDPVEQQMYGMYKPQLDAINYERQKAEAAGRRRMGDLAGFTQAIMGMLGEISPAVRGAYGEGAETMRAGGSGYGDLLNVDMGRTAAAGNTLLDVLGSGQRVEGGDAGSVLAGMAGWLPAEMLQKQGAAYGDMFAQLPKEASFQAQLEMKNLLADAAQTDDDFSNEILGILNGMPSTRVDLQNQRREQKLAQQEYKLKQLSEERDFWLKRQALLLSQGKLKLAQQAERRAQQAQQRYNYESQGRDSNGDPMPGYTVNPKTGLLIPPDYHIDKNGNVVKDSSSSSRRKFTPSQAASMIETIEGKREDIHADIVAAVQAGQWTPTSGDLKGRRKLGQQIFEKYKHLAGTPTAKKRLRKLIAEVLAKATKMGPPAPGGDSGSGGFWDS